MNLRCTLLILCIGTYVSSMELSVFPTGVFSKRELSNCSQVHHVPAKDQCTFIETNCITEAEIGRFNYLSMFYCSFSSLRSIAVILLLSCLGIFFMALGLTASDYLCPNLYTISKFLELSDNLAGLTLLAFGNGSPDVLSTYKAMSLDAGSLAISELMGAALFIITIVVGSMAVVHPFKVPKDLFVRDASFFLGVISLVLFSLISSYLNTFNCILLIGVYVVYVVMVVVNHSFIKTKLKQRLREERSRGNFSIISPQNNENMEDIFLDSFNDLPTIEELNFNNIRGQNIDGINGEYNELVRHQTSEGIPVETGSYGLKILLKELSKHSNSGIHLSDIHERPLTAPVISQSPQLFSDSDQPQTFPGYKPYRDQIDEQEQYENSEIITRNSQDNVSETSPEDNYLGVQFPPGPFTKQLDVNSIELLKLLAPNLLTFSEVNLVNKIYTLVALPMSIVLRLTTPVRDHSIILFLNKLEKNRINLSNNQPDDEVDFDFKLDRILLTIQFFTSINLLMFLVGGHFLIGFGLSIMFTALLNFNFNHKLVDLRYVNYIASFIGFAVAISWISIFATEIISILKTISIIYELSDDILGVTIFALGNSVGDFISNFTIAKMGMPLMAFGACFGGPLLSLSSMGISALILIHRDNKYKEGYKIEISKTLIVTGLSIISSIVILLIMIPKNNWVIDRKVGIMLIFTWLVATTICILFETFN